MTDKQISVDIIVCYNNKELYADFERTIYERGGDGVRWRIIGIDNTGNAFKSAAAAYNYALKDTSGDCVIFCHQDVLFLEGSLYTIAKKCVNFPNTLWGAAGVENTRKIKIISNMAVFQEGWKYGTIKAGEEADVQTLDECMIAASRSLFETVQFDEDTCNGWHLYAVDLSIQCLLSKRNVKVLDANIVHLSGGNMDSSFWMIAKRLAKKYAGKVHRINTTCCWIYTNPFLFKLLEIYRKIRHGIK